MGNILRQDSANFSLILIGTVHGDPRGQARAGKLLHHLRPDLVTVEISPFSLGYRLKHGRRWQRQLAAALARTARRGGAPPGHPAPGGPGGFALRGPGGSVIIAGGLTSPGAPWTWVFVQAAPAPV